MSQPSSLVRLLAILACVGLLLCSACSLLPERDQPGEVRVPRLHTLPSLDGHPQDWSAAFHASVWGPPARPFLGTNEPTALLAWQDQGLLLWIPAHSARLGVRLVPAAAPLWIQLAPTNRSAEVALASHPRALEARLPWSVIGLPQPPAAPFQIRLEFRDPAGLATWPARVPWQTIRLARGASREPRIWLRHFAEGDHALQLSVFADPSSAGRRAALRHRHAGIMNRPLQLEHGWARANLAMPLLPIHESFGALKVLIDDQPWTQLVPRPNRLIHASRWVARESGDFLQRRFFNAPAESRSAVALFTVWGAPLEPIAPRALLAVEPWDGRQPPALWRRDAQKRLAERAEHWAGLAALLPAAPDPRLVQPWIRQVSDLGWPVLTWRSPDSLAPGLAPVRPWNDPNAFPTNTSWLELAVSPPFAERETDVLAAAARSHELGLPLILAARIPPDSNSLNRALSWIRALPEIKAVRLGAETFPPALLARLERELALPLFQIPAPSATSSPSLAALPPPRVSWDSTQSAAVLSWPSLDPPPARFEIFRNSEPVGFARSTTWLDPDLGAGAQPLYQIRAIVPPHRSALSPPAALDVPLEILRADASLDRPIDLQVRAGSRYRITIQPALALGSLEIVRPPSPSQAPAETVILPLTERSSDGSYGIADATVSGRWQIRTGKAAPGVARTNALRVTAHELAPP